MILHLLFFLISFPFLLDADKCIRMFEKTHCLHKGIIKQLFTKKEYPNERIEPLFIKDEYEKIESAVSKPLKFKPEEKCPCGKDDLDKMKFFYFQWVHPVTNEMQLARYLISKTFLGGGGVGKVYHATMISYPENEPHKCVAIKMARKDVEVNEKIAKASINKEIEMAKFFRGTNHIIGYGPRHYYLRNGNVPVNAIVMEIGESFKNDWGQLDEIEMKMLKYLKQILFGIKEIHQKNFVHLDLKNANVVKISSNNDNESYLKLIDFGSAIKLENNEIKEVNKKKDDLIITPEFTAPEINVPKFFEDNCDTIKISKKADIWSFGMIILDLLASMPTLEEKDNPTGLFTEAIKFKVKGEKLIFEQFVDELKIFLEISKKNFPKITAIMEICLKWKPEDRPTAEELLKEKYFNDISIPTENPKNTDFFEKMTKYLDEQFKKISQKLKSEKFNERVLQLLPTNFYSNISEDKAEYLKNERNIYGGLFKNLDPKSISPNDLFNKKVSNDKAHYHGGKFMKRRAKIIPGPADSL